MAERVGRADLHMHTNASDGVPYVCELLNYVEHHTQLDVIAITDHDRVDASCWAYEHSERYSFDIIPGVEVTSAAGHVLGLWVTAPVQAGMSLAETVEAIHQQGGVAILAHPYHFYIDRIRHYFIQYTRHPHLLVEAGFDALEVHNAGVLLPGLNLLARRLARHSQLAMTGSSDAHTLGAIGSGSTRFVGTNADDLRRALVNRQTTAEGKTWPIIDYWNYLRNSTPNRSNGFLVEKPS